MIRFLTLYLGLVWGPVPLQFEVSADVAAIEIQVDGRTLGRIQQAPWKATLRLGSEVLPHEVDAIAFDAEGEEIARTSQWLNFGRSFTEARIVFVPGSDRRQVRVDAWSADAETPNDLKLFLDGDRVRGGQEGVFELPELDLDDLHYLVAEIGFPNGASVRPELTFGGIYGAVETSELTALAVELPEGMERPGPRDLVDWFEVDGRPLRVHSLGDEAPLVGVVRDIQLPVNLPYTKADRQLRDLADHRIESQDDLAYFLTVPQTVQVEGRETAIFPVISIERLQGGIRLLDQIRRPPPEAPKRPLPLDQIGDASRPEVHGGQQFYGAIAAAGKALSASGRPRLLLLLVDGRTRDASNLDWHQIRGLLDALQVPVVIWQDGPARGRRSVAVSIAEDDSTEPYDLLVEAAIAAGRKLERQIVVWVEGRYLPNRVGLGAGAPDGVRFARSRRTGEPKLVPGPAEVAGGGP